VCYGYGLEKTDMTKKKGLIEQMKVDKHRAYLRVSEIDEELSRILNLPHKPIQSYWNLQKKKRDALTKRNGF